MATDSRLGGATLTHSQSQSTSLLTRSTIPTPGRPRAPSVAAQPPLDDHEFAARAFRDAIKANHPANHRVQPAPPTFNGPRSAARRPHSAVTTSSTRPKTPTSARPPSRQSDVFSKSTARSFDVGDNVRIESLGYEGCLRYVGEIDGKPGLWAGVELSGGFAGKGKNNGFVNGKQYFSCQDNCGVFVAMSKLSPPTVGPGAIPRPHSVASSYGGRVTPALSGRITPSNHALFASRIGPSTSTSSGRVTPSSSGRITPSLSTGCTPGVTPAAKARRPLKSTTSNSDSSSANPFTAGSIASKYSTMTAKQLSSRETAPASPTLRSKEPSLPQSQSASRISSPTRASPFGTPKSTLSRVSTGLPTPTKVRSSLNTPRPRVPSAIAMPPPPSPMSGRSISCATQLPTNDLEEVLPSLDPLHDSINGSRSAGSITSLGRSDSSLSNRSSLTEDKSAIERLQSRIDALGYDNERLRAMAKDHVQTSLSAESPNNTLQENLKRERDEAIIRINELEASLATSFRATEATRVQLSSLVDQKQAAVTELEARRAEMQSTISALQGDLAREANAFETLEAAIAEQDRLLQEKEASITTHTKQIATLQQEIEGLSTEMQNERQDLGAQIDELRLAGQETIALYEERLNAVDSEKYELRMRISTLESGLQSTASQHAHPMSPLSKQSWVSGTTATEIDNETLREQVLHLQHKISTMEDLLEEAHAVARQEEAALREKILRLKEKEEVTRKELCDGRREVERLAKSETNARGRVEEIEEALRESTVALENARAEVETLRAELANLDGLVANSSGGDLYSRVAELAQRVSSDRMHYKEEITELHQRLEEHRAPETSTPGSPHHVEIMMLKEENSLLQQKSITLTQMIDQLSIELESLRKKNNREAIVNNGWQEITGLKHIVQELQKENSAASQRNKLLESDNQLLLSEAKQLRQEIQMLEENLDQSLVPEKIEALDGMVSDTPEKWKKERARLELERDQLEKQLAEAERKSTRTIHDLNKEISELEALVESKIYREDELEQELERTKEKLARQKTSSRSSSDAAELVPGVAAGGAEICEICERPGHDIFNCDVLNKEVPPLRRNGSTNSKSELYCEDCESHGHMAHDCPYSLDVF